MTNEKENKEATKKNKKIYDNMMATKNQGAPRVEDIPPGIEPDYQHGDYVEIELDIMNEGRAYCKPKGHVIKLSLCPSLQKQITDELKSIVRISDANVVGGAFYTTIDNKYLKKVEPPNEPSIIMKGQRIEKLECSYCNTRLHAVFSSDGKTLLVHKCSKCCGGQIG